MNRAPLLLLAAILTACSGPPPSGPVAGKAYFEQAGCVSCHRVGGEGSPGGPDLTLVGFRHSAAWLDRFIKDPAAWRPGTLMPRKDLPQEARAAIVAYLTTLSGQDWPKGARPWDGPGDAVARGRLVYLRAGCVACHGTEGVGGYPNNNVAGGKIPALNGVAETFTKKELVDKIKRGVPKPAKADPKGADPLVWMPAWGQTLDDSEIDAVASYLLSLKPGATGQSDW